MQSSNKITIYNISSTIILQGLTFIVAPIISRMLSPENYGIATVYVTWVSIASTIFGLQTQSSLAVARKEYDIKDQERYQSSVLFLSIVSFAIFSLAVCIFIRPLSGLLKLSIPLLLMLIPNSFGQNIVNFINIKNTYEFKAKNNFILTIITSLSTLGLSLVFIHIFPDDINYYGRVIGITIPYSIMGIVFSIWLIGKGKCYFNKEYWKFCISLCIPIILHSVSGLLLNQSDRVMLQNLCDNNSVGLYGLAFSFASVLTAIFNAFNNSWVPFYYEHTRKREYAILMKRAHNYLELFSVLSIGFVLLSKEVFHIFAGKEFWGGTTLIPVFAIGLYFTFLYSFPVNYEFYNKKTKIIATGTIAAAICNIILNYYLINSFNIMGAAFATSIAHFLQFIFHHICAKYFIKSEEKYPFSFGFLMAYFCMFAVGVILSIIFDRYALIRWGIGMAIGILEILRIYKRKQLF